MKIIKNGQTICRHKYKVCSCKFDYDITEHTPDYCMQTVKFEIKCPCCNIIQVIYFNYR